MTDGPPGSRFAPGTDRSVRLILFGSLSVAVGATLAALGLVQLLFPLVFRAERGLPAADWRTAISASLTCWVLAAALALAGVGSIRRRRWVPPVMRTLGWTWLLAGVFGLAMLVAVLDDVVLLASNGESVPAPEILVFAKLVLVCGGLIGGAVLPCAFLLAYRGPEVRRTCELHDPRPSWAERCPPPVLGLSLALGLVAMLLIPAAVRPMVPAFGTWVAGAPGSAMTLALAAVCGALAVAVYRRARGAWTGTNGLMLIVGLSCAETFRAAGPTGLYRTMGFPESELRGLATGGPLWDAALVWGTVALTVAGVGYMFGIRRQFRRNGVVRTDQT